MFANLTRAPTSFKWNFVDLTLLLTIVCAGINGLPTCVVLHETITTEIKTTSQARFTILLVTVFPSIRHPKSLIINKCIKFPYFVRKLYFWT